MADKNPIPEVSVIVPVYNDAERLRKCLRALKGQTYPGDRYNVIVVDNGSTDDVESVARLFDNVVLEKEEQKGVSAATNRGISVSNGEVLAFTDSDCIPAHDWIEKGVEALQKMRPPVIVCGRVELFFRDPDNLTAAELYEKIYAFRQEDYVKEGHCVTANAFVPREVFEKTGLFDTGLLTCQDKEWSERAVSAGYKLVYAGEAAVSHPARYTLGDLAKKCRGLTAGFHSLEKKGNYPAILAGYIGATFRDMARVFADKRLSGPAQRVKVLLMVIFIRCVYVQEKIRLALGGGNR